MSLDVVVRGGMVFDGLGSDPVRADVGIFGGKIATIGRIRELGREEIDADGHFVSPGFIEGHTHMDAQINWDPLGTCSCWHGVTSVIMGNCGFTLAPCAEGQRDLVLRSLERAEAISREAMLSGISWSWETFPQYLDAMSRIAKGINYATYVGHSALRTYVMGERAFEESATEADLLAMCGQLEVALRSGAMGLSTSRSSSHMTSDDRKVPSRLATWDEIRRLVQVMGDSNVGLFELARKEDEPGEDRLEYLERLRTLAVESRRPFFFMLVIAPDSPGLWADRLAYIDRTAREGGQMYAQVHPLEVSVLLGFEIALPFDQLPGWVALRRGSLSEQRKALCDREVRQRLVEEALTSEYRLLSGQEPHPPDYESIFLFDSPIGPYESVADLAAKRNITPVDFMIDVSLETEFKQLFCQIIRNHNLESVLQMLRHPRAIISGSDAGAHVSQISDSSIPTRFLSYWVHDREAFSWARAVQMLTSTPAQVYGLANRGRIQPGYAADLVVFDPRTIGAKLPVVTNDLPTGAKRLRQEAIGIAATIVNGEILFRHGVHTGALPGQFVRGAQAIG